MLSMLMTTEYAPAEDRHELQQLLIHIAGGEREALAELYQRTKSAVYGLALSYLKNAHDAQDLTQDVYVQVWDRAEQYRLIGSPMGWLLAVCRNLCLMRLRREERHAALSEEEWDAIPAQKCGLDADERALLQGALASLADEERRIVLLHAVTGLKHREIAALLVVIAAAALSHLEGTELYSDVVVPNLGVRLQRVGERVIAAAYLSVTVRLVIVKDPLTHLTFLNVAAVAPVSLYSIGHCSCTGVCCGLSCCQLQVRPL